MKHVSINCQNDCYTIMYCRTKEGDKKMISGLLEQVTGTVTLVIMLHYKSVVLLKGNLWYTFGLDWWNLIKFLNNISTAYSFKFSELNKFMQIYSFDTGMHS